MTFYILQAAPASQKQKRRGYGALTLIRGVLPPENPIRYSGIFPVFQA